MNRHVNQQCTDLQQTSARCVACVQQLRSVSHIQTGLVSSWRGAAGLLSSGQSVKLQPDSLMSTLLYRCYRTL